MPDSNITKNALASALKTLMRGQPFVKISVGDICELCGMNRKSFYYHFKDKYDLINWIFDTEFIAAASLSDYTTGWDFFTDICRYFYSQREFYSCALQITGQNSFVDYFRQKIELTLQIFTGEYFSDLEDPSFFATFFSDAFMAAILRWLTDGGEDIPPEKFLEQIRKIIVIFSRRVIETLDM